MATTIEKTNRIDLYLEQLEKKENTILKKKVGIGIGIGLLFTIGMGITSNILLSNSSSPSTPPQAKIAISAPLEVENESLSVIEKEDVETVVDDENITEFNSIHDVPNEVVSQVQETVSSSPIKMKNTSLSSNRESEYVPEVPVSVNQIQEDILNTPIIQNNIVPPSGNPVGTKNTISKINRPIGVSPKNYSPEEVKDLPEAITFPTPKIKSIEKKKEVVENKSIAPKKEIAPEPAKKTEVEKESETDKIIPEVISPQYPGGKKALQNYLRRNIDYPNAAYESKKEGVVNIRVKINKDGKIENPSVINSLGPEFDAEVIQALEKMKKWEPAKVNGIPTEKYYILSVTFEMDK